MNHEEKLQEAANMMRKSIEEECKNNPDTDPYCVAIDFLIRITATLSVHVGENMV